MKKVFLFVFAFVAMTFASCGNKQGNGAAPAEEVEKDSVAIVSNSSPETVAADLQQKLQSNDAEGFKQTVKVAKEKIDEMVKAGDVEGAKAYASKVKAFVDENAEAIKQLAGGSETVSTIVNTINSIPVNAEKTVNEAGEAVKADAQKTMDDAEVAAKAKVEETKDKAKQKATEEVNKAKDKANQEVDKAANKALKKLGL